jgi:dipeptidyl-peptidase-4
MKAFRKSLLLLVTLLALPSGAPTTLFAQDRLPSMPGYARLSVTWAEDGGSFEYSHGGTRFRYDIARREAVALPPEPEGAQGPPGARRGSRPARGRQYDSTLSPDSTLRAFYRDRNLFISAPDGSNEIAVTTDGSEETRVKYGTASWVYGEELGQSTAMWWSPDGSKLGYYRFDESQVPDYYLQLGQTEIQSSLDVEAYPKAGAPNPIVDLFVYDVASGETRSPYTAPTDARTFWSTPRASPTTEAAVSLSVKNGRTAG